MDCDRRPSRCYDLILRPGATVHFFDLECVVEISFESYFFGFVRYESASIISLAGIAPSRRICHVPSSRKCTIVDEIVRGDSPPSTIIEMRSCNCSRTCSAVVHSEDPLRFADVAVMGIFAARTTANGISAAGTRSATLPVFAVTFSGRCDAAGTIIVSGPG